MFAYISFSRIGAKSFLIDYHPYTCYIHAYDFARMVLNHVPINYLFIYNFEILKIW